MNVIKMEKIERPKKKEVVELLFSGKLYYKRYEESEPIKAGKDLLEWLSEMIDDGISFYEAKSYHWTELLHERGFWCVCWQASATQLGQSFEFITDFRDGKYISSVGLWDGALPLSDWEVERIAKHRGIGV